MLFDGIDVTRATPAQRRIGLVFQHYALFKHLTVLDNIAFGLTLRRGAARVDAGASRAKASQLLQLVQLDGLGERYPGQLSGGQRQRVGLARALAIEPRVLLLDEPFGALDAQVRNDLRRLQRELRVTTLFVTHDQEEALELADRVAVIHRGRLQQVGRPDDVYEHPSNPFVCEFLGNSNRFAARADGGVLHLAGTALPLADGRASGAVLAYVRPHDVELLRGVDGEGLLPVTVDEIHVVGSLVHVLARLKEGHDAPFEVHVSRGQFGALALQRGDQLYARLSNLKLFPATALGPEP